MSISRSTSTPISNCRPASPVDSQRRNLVCGRALTSFIVMIGFVGVLMTAQPSSAEWNGAAVEEVAAKVVDAVIVRPLAALRVGVGAVFFVPGSLLASPSGKEGINTAYDVLIAAPMEYAFDRELGDF